MPTTRPSVSERALALGRTLRACRKAQRVTMAAAAEAAGMSRLTWHRIENGETGVAWRFVLAAVNAVGLDIRADSARERAEADRTTPAVASGDWLPLKIQPEEFPGLQRLAWQASPAPHTLTPREAWELYERNGRHLDQSRLVASERALIDALGQIYGNLDASF